MSLKVGFAICDVADNKPGDNADALYYEVLDMEHAIISGDVSAMQLGFSKDVMDLMTAFRKEWGVSYPEEER